jgi:hypothetical protein
MVSRKDDSGRESYIPGAAPRLFQPPDEIGRVRSLLVLALTGYVSGLREEDRGDTVAWIIDNPVSPS